MRKFILIALLIGLISLGTGGRLSYAGEIDLLLEKLVNKGVLTGAEAQQIKYETQEKIKKEIATGKSASLPSWVQNTKLKGDLRLRHQWDDKDKDSVSGRHRIRARARIGVESKVNEKVQVGIGLASGSTDARSTNQTFQDSFSTKTIMLDYFYAQYAVLPELTLYGGKMMTKPVLWVPTDLLWDGDVNPEGFAAAFAAKNFFVNAGFFIMDESSSKSSEPWMAYLQPGAKFGLTDDISLKLALTGYLVNTKGYDVDGSAGTNTKEGANHRYDYDALSPAVELSFKEPFGGIVEQAGIFAEYVSADEPFSNNHGWAAGVKFGAKKVNKGQWQAKYIYRHLERDAWFDGLPDTDAFDGDTHVKGHEVALTYGLAKNITLGLDYYHMEPINAIAGHTAGDKQHLIQTDVVFKF